MFIDGEWRDATSGATVEATSPATGESLGLAAEVMERRSGELARALTLDQGKPLKAEAEVEVGELIEFFRMAAEDGKRLEGTIPQSATAGRRVLLLRRPRGR